MAELKEPSLIDFPGAHTAVIAISDLPLSEIQNFMDAAFTTLGRAIGEGLFVPTGPAFSRYEAPPAENVTFQVGFPIQEPLQEPFPAGDYQILPSELPSGRLAIARHHGSYEALGQSWGQFMQWVQDNNLQPGLPFWEAYDTEPTPDMDPEDLITGLAVPVTEPAAQ